MTSQRCCFVVLALLGCQAGDTSEQAGDTSKQAGESKQAGDSSKQAEVQALPSVTTLPAPILTASKTPVILIYGESLGLVVPADQGQVDVAVWHDGHTVWRVNDSLLEGRIETANIEHLLQQLHREGVFGSGRTRFDNFGPDSSFDVIEIRLADRDLQLRSWHEGSEENEELVVTSHGVELLRGRKRDAVLAAEPYEYRRFRKVWSDIRSTVRSWLPSQGEPFTGTIPISRGQ